jgi:5'-nucleotidase (lipoprotein e(P4) family)
MDSSGRTSHSSAFGNSAQQNAIFDDLKLSLHCKIIHMKRIYYFFFTATFLVACSSQQKVTTAFETQQANLVFNGKLYAAAYMQKAAEYHALCLQAYNIARWRLDEALKLHSEKPRAIITDIDETILNNSAEEVHRDLLRKSFNTEDWNKWVALAAADTIPGAPSFLQYAASKGVEIFYISNRNEKDREATLKNLQKFNFPNADNTHLLVMQNSSSKESRRRQVMATYDVVLLLGDYLADFSDLWDKKTIDERLQNAKQQSALFGNRYIILPNPVYGDWESAIYQYKQLTAAQKDSAIKSGLKSY